MEPFGKFDVKRGLTYHFNNGHISTYHTIAKNNIFEWVKDVRDVDARNYDVVITDYEPVTAWAAKLKRGCQVLE